MATVRFSDELRGIIASRAAALFTAQLEAAMEVPPHWGDMVYALIYRDTIADMDRLPSCYFRTASSMYVMGMSGGPARSFTAKMADLRPVPYSTDDTWDGLVREGRAATTYSSGVMLSSNDPRWAEFRKEYEQWDDAVSKIEFSRKTFIEGVEAVVKAHSTLGPALKVWPALWQLLPSEVQARHKQVVERKRGKPSAVDMPNIDLDTMTGISIAARLRGE